MPRRIRRQSDAEQVATRVRRAQTYGNPYALPEHATRRIVRTSREGQ